LAALASFARLSRHGNTREPGDRAEIINAHNKTSMHAISSGTQSIVVPFMHRWLLRWYAENRCSPHHNPCREACDTIPDAIAPPLQSSELSKSLHF
jgi:hypothetical protein